MHGQRNKASNHKGRKEKLPAELIRTLAKQNSYRLRIVLCNPDTPKTYRRAIYNILLERKHASR